MNISNNKIRELNYGTYFWAYWVTDGIWVTDEMNIPEKDNFCVFVKEGEVGEIGDIYMAGGWECSIKPNDIVFIKKLETPKMSIEQIQEVKEKINLFNNWSNNK